MNSTKLKTIIEIIIGLVSILGTFGVSFTANDTFKTVVLVIIGVLAFALIFYGTYSYVKIKSQERLSSNAGITKKANTVCKSLNKMIVANEKRLKKYYSLSQEKVDSDKTNRILDKINRNLPQKTLEQLIGEHERIKRQFINTILEMERILLISEQYKYRIKFGLYIVKHSDDVYDKIEAYIDFIGWTYVILGKTGLAKKYIKLGIEEIDNKINSADTAPSERQELLMKKIRAYRHLGSNYNEYVKKPQDCLEELDKADKLMQNEEFRKYYEGKTKYVEMEAGIQYGIAICNLYKFKKHKHSANDKNEAYEMLKKSCELTAKYLPIAATFANKHRHVKYLLLANSITEEIMLLPPEVRDKYQLKLIDIAEYSEKQVIKRYQSNVSEVEKVLNNSLFADDAMLFYLKQKEILVEKHIDVILEY